MVQKTTSIPLNVCVRRSLREYFEKLGDEDPINLYELVIAETECPLLEVVMHHTRGNISKAAQILGVFEPARAAALTRAVLGSARTGN